MERKDNSSVMEFYAAVQRTRPLLRHIEGAVESLLEGSGITVGQRAVLEALLQIGPATAPELTSHLKLTRQFIARMLSEVLAKKLIQTQENPNHKRAHFYVLTTSGQDVINEIRKVELASLEAFLSGFSETEISNFTKVQTALDEWFLNMVQTQREN